MGQALNEDNIVSEDVFIKKLRDETSLVMRWFKNHKLEHRTPPLIGAEVEAWLLDENHLPCPANTAFLDAINHKDLDAELAQFNFELNLPPVELGGRCFDRLYDSMKALWTKCHDTAEAKGWHAMMIGMAPTLREGMLTLDTITPAARYRALNDRVMHLRGDQPLNYSFDGQEDLEIVHDHLMLEAACTSLQTHLMLDPDRQARQFNAAIIASAPVLAVSANSPYLYGHRLWEETRIPAFEQAIPLKNYRDRDGRQAGRVTFGSSYVRKDLRELFLDNLSGYPPLLPISEDSPREDLKHFKMQNGTVWRWNRPIIDCNDDGVPHVRLENRITPAGPTVKDMTANAAFLIGLIYHLAGLEEAPEHKLDFKDARENFYAAAKRGLGANITWLDGQSGDIQTLVAGTLCDQSLEGLISAGVDKADARNIIDIIRQRARTGMNGAAWQRAWVNCNGTNFQGLTEAYLAHQDEGHPVHTWSV